MDRASVYAGARIRRNAHREPELLRLHTPNGHRQQSRRIFDQILVLERGVRPRDIEVLLLAGGRRDPQLLRLRFNIHRDQLVIVQQQFRRQRRGDDAVLLVIGVGLVPAFDDGKVKGADSAMALREGRYGQLDAP